MTVFSGRVTVSDSVPTLLLPGVADPDQLWEFHLFGGTGLVVGGPAVTHADCVLSTDDHVFRFHGPLYGLYPAGSGGGTVNVLALGQ
jgi:hypothetical protein